MKTLTILRHAKSGWDVQVERDFDRPINARGRRGAELIGQYVKRQAFPIDRIIASPAVRVTETLDLFQPAAALDALEPHWDRRIYLASAATLIDVIRDKGKDAAHLLISGHNPGLEDLVLELVPSDGCRVQHRAEGHDPVAALPLGVVHRQVGVAQQVFGGGAPVRVGESHAGPDDDGDARDLHLGAQRLEDARAHRLGVPWVGGVLDHDRELVASEASEQVPRPQLLAEPLPDRGQ